jgi:RND family efflux transporter MFP subunit
MTKRMQLLLLVLLIGLLISGCELTQSETEQVSVPLPVLDDGVVAEAMLVPADYLVLHFALPGRVAEVKVEEGEEVEVGQLLASLDQAEAIEAQLLAANLAVMEAEQRLEEAERYGSNDDALDLANAALDLAEGQQRAARRALEDLNIIAPFSGQVIRIDIQEGSYTSPAEVAMVIADLSVWQLETIDLNENEVVNISNGDAVEIVFDALPDFTFAGEVESISDYFLERFGNVTYVVRINIAEKDERLRWGMTAEVRFPD